MSAHPIRSLPKGGGLGRGSRAHVSSLRSPPPHPPPRGREQRVVVMQLFADLLDALSYQPARNGKLRLIEDYLRHAPDPDRGYALAALCGELDLPGLKPASLARDDGGAGRSGIVRLVVRLCRRPGRDHRPDLAQRRQGDACAAALLRGGRAPAPCRARGSDDADGGLARRARRHRPLGAVEAGGRRAARRRVRAAGEDRAQRHRQREPGRHRRAVAAA